MLASLLCDVYVCVCVENLLCVVCMCWQYIAGGGDCSAFKLKTHLSPNRKKKSTFSAGNTETNVVVGIRLNLNI